MSTPALPVPNGRHDPVPGDRPVRPTSLRRGLGQLLRPHRWAAVLAVLVVVVQAGATVAGPAVVRHGIDAGVGESDLGVLNRSAVTFVVLVVVAYVAGRGAIRLISRLGETVLRDLRTKVFDHLMSLSQDFYDRTRTGVLVSRMTADIDAMQQLVNESLATFVVALLLFVGSVTVMLAMSWELSVAVLLVVPLLAAAGVWFQRASDRAYLTLRDRIGATLTAMQEGLAGVRVAQAFGAEPRLSARFRSVNEEQMSAHLDTQRIAALYFPTVDLAKGIAIAAALVVGGLMSSPGQAVITVGTVAAFVLYLQNVFDPIQQLSQLFNTFQSSAAALRKLFELLDERPTLADAPGARPLPRSSSLVVEDVAFRYADGPLVLSGVTLAVEPGERLALVGPTGAGKSTLAKLMSRTYDPTSGRVTYGGLDLRDASLASLRERIMVVPQEGFLFAGTVRDNIVLGRPDVGDAEISAVLRRLGIGEQLLNLPDGLDTEIRQRGSNLSAGQRQLVSLSRCALADPDVLVLDEATSSLDLGTEQLVEQAFERMMTGRSVIVIAHRLSTAVRADRVAVVDHGHLVEHGTHAELLARAGAYSRLFAAWEGAQS